jgi:hypothetical protein
MLSRTIFSAFLAFVLLLVHYLASIMRISVWLIQHESAAADYVLARIKREPQ